MEKPAQWALVGAAWFLALTVALAAFLAWRHFDRQSAANAALSAAQQGVEAPLPVGATTVCPVTHESLVITAETPHLVYMEHHYYFSSTPDANGHDAKRRFLMDPEFYVHPGAAPLATLVPNASAPTPAPTAPQPTLVPTLRPGAITSSKP